MPRARGDDGERAVRAGLALAAAWWAAKALRLVPGGAGAAAELERALGIPAELPAS